MPIEFHLLFVISHNLPIQCIILMNFIISFYAKIKLDWFWQIIPLYAIQLYFLASYLWVCIYKYIPQWDWDIFSQQSLYLDMGKQNRDHSKIIIDIPFFVEGFIMVYMFLFTLNLSPPLLVRHAPYLLRKLLL